jgi:hypothetical protein
LVTVADDQLARIWDANTGEQLLVLPGHSARVGMAAFAPDGLRLATASDDKTARIWDIHTVGLPAQMIWAEAAQLDGLSARERFELGLPPTASRRWPRSGDACDDLAAAPYDPDRLRPGVELEHITANASVEACTAATARGQAPRLAYERGRALLAARQHALARAQLEAAVSNGYRSAQIDLAQLLSTPSAGMLDPPRAISLYESAWKAGVTFAAFKLGNLFENGIVPEEGGKYILSPDASLAWQWYRRGIEVDEPHALARSAENEQAAAVLANAGEKNAHLLKAFALYATAAELAYRDSLPENEWQVWRYRRASLARLLAEQGMISEAAAAFGMVQRNLSVERPFRGARKIPIGSRQRRSV